MVNSSEIGDVYRILAKPDIVYPIVSVDITGLNYNYYDDSTSPILSYNAYIYYADRTLQDNTNVKQIQSDACLTLQALINRLFDDFGMEADYTINVWEQKFSDYCAGAEAQVTINVFNDLGECDIDEPEDPTPPTPPTPEADYLRFTALENNATIKIKKVMGSSTAEPPTINMQYSYDKEEWLEYNEGDFIILGQGETIYCRGLNKEWGNYRTNIGYHQFEINNGKIAAAGNFFTLINYVDNDYTLPKWIKYPASLRDMYGFYNCFKDCTSLVTAPDLKTETLEYQCYYGMFNGCSNLNYIKCLATDLSAQKCLYNWTSGVAATGSFIKDANTTWPTGRDGIPEGWTIIDA